MEAHEESTPETSSLPSPDALREAYPLHDELRRFVARARADVRAVLHGDDPRLFVVVGPCSIHDPAAALVYARQLRVLAERHGDALLVCMRSYFEKPRTTTGWKGLLNDPTLDGRCDLALGLRTARALMHELTTLGLPLAGEALDPLAQHYLADLFTWSAIGARTTESQTHRELASGLGMPVGFKNGTDGSIEIALNAMRSAARPHTFLGLDAQGRGAAVRTRGNPHTHVVLRGGQRGPNYGEAQVSGVTQKLREAALPTRVMVDCSHDNCQRDHRKQALVAANIAAQIEAGSEAIMGVMLESHLVEGRQELRAGGALTFGQSITDACIDLAETERVLAVLADAVRTRARCRQGARASLSVAAPC